MRSRTLNVANSGQHEPGWITWPWWRATPVGCLPTSAPSQQQTPHTPAAFWNCPFSRLRCLGQELPGGVWGSQDRKRRLTLLEFSNCCGTSEKRAVTQGEALQHCWKAADSPSLFLVLDTFCNSTLAPRSRLTFYAERKTLWQTKGFPQQSLGSPGNCHGQVSVPTSELPYAGEC